MSNIMLPEPEESFPNCGHPLDHEDVCYECGWFGQVQQPVRPDTQIVVVNLFVITVYLN